MIGISDIYIAIRKTVETACQMSAIQAPVLASDLSEPIVRPSIKIQLDDDAADRDFTHLRTRGLTARIYYFSPDAHNWREDVYRMQDALREPFSDDLMVGGFALPTAEGIQFTQPDGVMCGTVAYDWVEQLPSHDEGEPMDVLDLQFTT